MSILVFFILFLKYLQCNLNIVLYIKITLIKNTGDKLPLSIFQVIVLGMVEGITEFLPISSTGHLIVVSSLLNIPQNSISITYEVSIQLGSILAVFYEYRNLISDDLNLWIKILIGTMPVGLLGLFFYKVIFKLFTIEVVATSFIVGGILFIIVERFLSLKPHIHNLKEISLKKSLIIGLFQAISLIPGSSRSGMTIIGGMLSGLDRKTATEFSFLLSLPVMILATSFTIFKHFDELNINNVLNIVLGFIVSFIVATLAIRWLLDYVKRHDFTPFGIYRIIFGIILLIFFHNAIIS